MSDDADRRELAERQARLVAALTAGDATPAGFDDGRVGLTARTLVRKRMRGVAKTWPMLRAALGERFGESFAEYAGANTLSDGGAPADGRGFAEWLLRAGQLPDAGRVELLVRRAASGFPVRVMRLGDVARLVVAVRVWRAGVWRVALPFPRRKNPGRR